MSEYHEIEWVRKLKKSMEESFDQEIDDLRDIILSKDDQLQAADALAKAVRAYVEHRTLQEAGQMLGALVTYEKMRNGK